MHSASKRFSFAISSLFNPTVVLLFSIFACSLLFVKPLPSTDIHVVEISSQYYKRYVTFNPNVDLSTQFNFNVKQIFLYLTVVYPNKSSEMLWSTIVKRGDNYKFNYNLKNTYDIRGEAGREVTLELRGNYFPFVGIIRDFKLGSIKTIL